MSGSEFARTIPGASSDELGNMAKQHKIWIAAALVEKVPGGVYDTNVLIDNRGRVVLKRGALDDKLNVGIPC